MLQKNLVQLLKICAEKKDVHRGAGVHSDILRMGLLAKSPYLVSAVINMYAECGVLPKARQVHDALSFPCTASWNALISGYIRHGEGLQAVYCFQKMQNEGLLSDAITFISILKGCGTIGAIRKGYQIHCEILSRDLSTNNIMLGTALICMYSKCGLLVRAQRVHNEIEARDVISWSALIAGYAEAGRGHEALDCFEQMQAGILSNVVTFICVLKACSSIGAIEDARQIHHEIVCRGMLQESMLLGTALIDMYVKCGVVAEAQQVHDQLLVRDIVSWSTLIAGYAQQEQCHEALKSFKCMQDEGHIPNAVTFTCILKACANLGAIDRGRRIHNDLVTMDLLGKDVVLGTALVDMYAKCGVLTEAQRVHEELNSRNEASWNALITGYAQGGHGHEALICFKNMQNEGLSPNLVTFITVLNACSRAGLIDEAKAYFVNMNKTYSISPNCNHHTCMVTVFSSAGHFDEAMLLIKMLPDPDHPPLWIALLGSCEKWGNVKLGRLSFDEVLKLDRTCAAAYLLMINIYAAAGMYGAARDVETLRLKLATCK